MYRLWLIDYGPQTMKQRPVRLQVLILGLLAIELLGILKWKAVLIEHCSIHHFLEAFQQKVPCLNRIQRFFTRQTLVENLYPLEATAKPSTSVQQLRIIQDHQNEFEKCTLKVSAVDQRFIQKFVSHVDYRPIESFGTLCSELSALPSTESTRLSLTLCHTVFLSSTVTGDTSAAVDMRPITMAEHRRVCLWSQKNSGKTNYPIQKGL